MRVEPPFVNPAGDTALVGVVPTSGPTSEATEDLIAMIRDHAERTRSRDGVMVAVTGQTAIDVDTSAELADALVPYLVDTMRTVTALLAERTGAAPDDLAIRTFTGAAFGVMLDLMLRWSEDPALNLAKALDEALATLDPGPAG